LYWCLCRADAPHESVTDQHIDPVRLAALLDGRLSDAEAAALRAQLAASDDDTLAAYTDAVAVAKEFEAAGGGGTPGAAPSAITPWRRWWWLTPSLAAAAVLVVAVLMRAPRGGTSEGAPASYVAALGPKVPVPMAPVWDATRSTDVVTTRGRAIRVGALATNLELAARRGDTSFASAARAMASLLEGDAVVLGAAMGDRLRTLASAARPTLEETRKTLRQAMRLVDDRVAGVGAWLEAARVADDAGQAALVERFPAPAALAPLMQDARLDAAQRAALDRVLRASSAVRRSPVELRVATEKLLREMAR
jgi:hypothetical protein